MKAILIPAFMLPAKATRATVDHVFMAKKTVSILGCGWLGLPLGALLAEQGYRVKGSTTTPRKVGLLQENGIEPYLLTLDRWVHGKQVGDFFQSDVLFLNVSPGWDRPSTEAYGRDVISSLFPELRYGAIDHVLFASSTSVYEPRDGWIREVDAGRPRPWSLAGRALLDAERLLMTNPHFDTTILRFGELYGYDRKPGHTLIGAQRIEDGDAPVNLVHRDDALGVALHVVKKDVRGEVFNVCADEHPTRKVLYTRMAQSLGLDIPVFTKGNAASHRYISNEKLKTHLGYRFKYPNLFVEGGEASGLV